MASQLLMQPAIVIVISLCVKQYKVFLHYHTESRDRMTDEGNEGGEKMKEISFLLFRSLFIQIRYFFNIISFFA